MGSCQETLFEEAALCPKCIVQCAMHTCDCLRKHMGGRGAMVAYSLLVRGERLWDAVVPPPPPPAQPPLCGFCGGAVEGTWASRPAIIHAPSTSRDWLTCSHLLCLLCRCQGVATYQITYRKCACSLSGLANNSTSPKHSPTRPPAPSLQDLRSDEASFTHVPLFPQRGLFQLWLSQRKTPKNMASFQTPGSAFSVRWCRSERNIRPLPSGEW